MTAKKIDSEPWIPKVATEPLFTNSANYERGLDEASHTPNIDVPNDGAEDAEGPASPATSNPFIKPAG